MLRRQLLSGAFASTAVLTAGATLDSALPSIAAVIQGRVPVRLGYLGNPCEAVTFVAANDRNFRQHGLEARLVAFQSEDALVAGLSGGAVDAASINLAALLKPLSNGSEIRVVAGLHAGCLRVVATDDVVMRVNGTMKGAVIATDRLHGASMRLLSALLRRQDIDPIRDVTWQPFGLADIDALESALDAKTVQLVAASDPLAYLLLSEKKAEPYLNVGANGFSCGDGIGGGHHCFLAMHSRFVQKHERIAASLTRAYIETSAEIGRGVGPAALAEAQGAYVNANLPQTIEMLSSYNWTASTDLVLEELELTANDFRRAGLLSASTDPERLAERAYADVLHG